ncbi:hypothetical protein QL288_25280, partial [Citrobacter youngae]|nr:hypothetical protein [Citrobacter youngae]
TGGTADRNRSHWSTSKTPSYTKSVSWQHHRQFLHLDLEEQPYSNLPDCRRFEYEHFTVENNVVVQSSMQGNNHYFTCRIPFFDYQYIHNKNIRYTNDELISC